MRYAPIATILVLGCSLPNCESKPAAQQHRVEVRKVEGDMVELIPKEGVPPFCLAFSIAEKRGVVRQLTMSEENKSIDCPTGQPVGGTSYRIPKEEGKVRIFVFFSDQKLKAASVAYQVSDQAANPNISALDLRLPGKVISDVVDYP